MSYYFDDTEAAHLAEIEECRDCGSSDYDHEEFLIERSEGVAHDELLYKLNKRAKVGTRITCAGPLCRTTFIKKSYQQCFCCTKHKDQFWNRREAHFGYRKPIE